MVYHLSRELLHLICTCCCVLCMVIVCESYAAWPRPLPDVVSYAVYLSACNMSESDGLLDAAASGAHCCTLRLITQEACDR